MIDYARTIPSSSRSSSSSSAAAAFTPAGRRCSSSSSSSSNIGSSSTSTSTSSSTSSSRCSTSLPESTKRPAAKSTTCETDFFRVNPWLVNRVTPTSATRRARCAVERDRYLDRMTKSVTSTRQTSVRHSGGSICIYMIRYSPLGSTKRSAAQSTTREDILIG